MTYTTSLVMGYPQSSHGATAVVCNPQRPLPTAGYEYPILIYPRYRCFFLLRSEEIGRQEGGGIPKVLSLASEAPGCDMHRVYF